MTFAKRTFDVVMSTLGLVVLSPLFAGTALAIKLFDHGPVFFRQERVGRDGRSFEMLKFRSMVQHAEQAGPQLTIGADRRITPIGRLLRQSKLDELPQLINVLRGEMSLVGPRPEVPRYVALYTPEQRRVLALVPGITDPASHAFIDESAILAQASDPERAYIEEIMPAKLALNLAYAERANLREDLVMILRTVGAIASRPASRT